MANYRRITTTFCTGKPTAVPGSWIAGHATCKQPGCAALVANGKTPDCIQAAECSQCAADRRSRILVAQGPTDKRFQAEFADAVAIFGTNDIKYHVNKLRALQWAKARGKQPYLFVAQDVASAPVVQEKANLTSEKLGWLQRHDKECGGLYGVLPLCVGMPVRAMDHLDRKRGILKGTKGHVVGWSKITNETPAPEGVVCNKLPAVVYVQFQTTTTWQIQGVPDANVYRNSRALKDGPGLRATARCFLNRQASSLSCLSSSREGSQTAPSPHRNSRALKDGPGLRATAPSS